MNQFDSDLIIHICRQPTERILEIVEAIEEEVGHLDFTIALRDYCQQVIDDEEEDSKID